MASSYTVIYRPDVGEVGRNGDNRDRFERHTMEHRDGMLIFRPKRHYGNQKTVEIPMDVVLRVEHS